MMSPRPDKRFRDSGRYVICDRPWFPEVRKFDRLSGTDCACKRYVTASKAR
jgi:hypothetical protein